MTNTRFYSIKPGQSGWARIWITDDGCLVSMSDWGSYCYWWDAFGSDIRTFLCSCNTDYLATKFARGQQEYDGDATVANVRRFILDQRRSLEWDAAVARKEWDLLNYHHPVYVDDLARWVAETRIELLNHSGLVCYGTPSALLAYLKNVWPLFVDLLRAELATEAQAPVTV